MLLLASQHGISKAAADLKVKSIVTDSLKANKRYKSVKVSLLNNCIENIILNQIETNTEYLYTASNSIIASQNYTIAPSSYITMKAGKVIVLKPGVKVMKGNRYLARIEPCKKEDCEIDLAYPMFFTPNGDGINDYWNIEKTTLQSKADVQIEIFDRYGKLLKVISSKENGWDGTLNDRPLPATDYWFMVSYIDCTGNYKEIRSHFTLKR